MVIGPIQARARAGARVKAKPRLTQKRLAPTGIALALVRRKQRIEHIFWDFANVVHYIVTHLEGAVGAPQPDP
jgi:hypothetical protein